MTRTGADTEGLVKHLVEALVDNPGQVSVEREDQGNTVAFKVRLDQSDIGKVIGRNGRIIKAIRVLARAAGSAEGLHVEVDIDG